MPHLRPDAPMSIAFVDTLRWLGVDGLRSSPMASRAVAGGLSGAGTPPPRRSASLVRKPELLFEFGESTGLRKQVSLADVAAELAQSRALTWVLDSFCDHAEPKGVR